MELNTEIEAFKNAIDRAQCEIGAMEMYLFSLKNALDYLEWLQGILTLCRTGK